MYSCNIEHDNCMVCMYIFVGKNLENFKISKFINEKEHDGEQNGNVNSMKFA